MQITIVGGGFGGIKAALELAKKRRHTITLISDRDEFQYYPSLFATATGGSHRQSWVPLADIFRHHRNVTIVRDSIIKIDPSMRLLKGQAGEYRYHTLILALGSVTSYFGIKGLDQYAYGIKSEDEIRELQQHLYDEMSDGSDDEKNYVIVGAGPTGVELAGALGEYIKTLRLHFGIRKKSMKISLIEAAPRVLPKLSVETSQAAHRRLRKLGIHIQTKTRVERQTVNSLIVNDKPLVTQTVIWTSGVTNAAFFTENKAIFTLNERGKVVVDAYLQALPNVYVIGDNAATPYSGMAQTALHDAIYVAKRLGGSKKPYRPVMPSCVVPIGRHWAVFERGKLRFSGWIGSLFRMAADFVGYSDILPIGWAFEAWTSMKKKEMKIPSRNASTSTGNDQIK
ncbi:NADH dehydrogenase Ndh [Candidatus Saccharibacteria bacterium RAAC3_TM7_1]|nr:NADH dehydrogenase Ndh [Candidatus Saccharibacteria bacterium RAAC3_TM7_1]HCZ28496.1 hypothetical protein [Candidatus Saccharibacteria bacterium]